MEVPSLTQLKEKLAKLPHCRPGATKPWFEARHKFLKSLPPHPTAGQVKEKMDDATATTLAKGAMKNGKGNTPGEIFWDTHKAHSVVGKKMRYLKSRLDEVMLMGACRATGLTKKEQTALQRSLKSAVGCSFSKNGWPKGKSKKKKRKGGKKKGKKGGKLARKGGKSRKK